MSEELIKKSDVIKAIHNYWKKRIETLPTKMSEYGEVYEDINEMNKILEHNKTLCSFVKAIPTIDAVSVVHGEWKPNPKIGWGETWVCSICGEKTTSSVMGYPRYRYCPMCGAKMYKENE